MPGSDLWEPRNDGDVHVRSGIQFLFSIELRHLFDARDLYGSCNTWSCLIWLGPYSFEMAILKTSHAAFVQDLRYRGCQGGEPPRWVPWLQLGLGWTQAVPDVTSSLWRSISVFPTPPGRSVSVSSSPRASIPFFLILAFLLSRRIASPLRHKGLLAIDVLFCFGERLGHAFLRVLRDGEH